MCEKDTPDGDISSETDTDTCPYCPTSKISLELLSGPVLVRHMSGHVLHDVRLKDCESPCGFCLSTGTTCVIYLIRGSKGAMSIDMKSSQCTNLRKIPLKSAATFSHSSKCSNHPMACPLCPPKSPAVWKYNLRSHIVRSHPTADVELYKTHFDITQDEITLMKGVFQTVPRRTKKTHNAEALPISDGHSTRMALRLVPSYHLTFETHIHTLVTTTSD